MISTVVSDQELLLQLIDDILAEVPAELLRDNQTQDLMDEPLLDTQVKSSVIISTKNQQISSIQQSRNLHTIKESQNQLDFLYLIH